jgi:amino acid permease
LVAVLLAVPVGYMGYLAFGDQVESVIIYNLPPNDTISIIAKCFYVITIMGSYIIVI